MLNRQKHVSHKNTPLVPSNRLLLELASVCLAHLSNTVTKRLITAWYFLHQFHQPSSISRTLCSHLTGTNAATRTAGTEPTNTSVPRVRESCPDRSVLRSQVSVTTILCNRHTDFLNLFKSPHCLCIRRSDNSHLHTGTAVTVSPFWSEVVLWGPAFSYLWGAPCRCAAKASLAYCKPACWLLCFL